MTPPPASAEALAASVSSAGAAATGRFYFRKKTLSYSIVANERFGFPKLLTFLDQERNIIEEFPLQTTPFQNVTGKVCVCIESFMSRAHKNSTLLGVPSFARF